MCLDSHGSSINVGFETLYTVVLSFLFFLIKQLSSPVCSFSQLYCTLSETPASHSQYPLLRNLGPRSMGSLLDDPLEHQHQSGSSPSPSQRSEFKPHQPPPPSFGVLITPLPSAILSVTPSPRDESCSLQLLSWEIPLGSLLALFSSSVINNSIC